MDHRSVWDKSVIRLRWEVAAVRRLVCLGNGQCLTPGCRECRRGRMAAIPKAMAVTPSGGLVGVDLSLAENLA